MTAPAPEAAVWRGGGYQVRRSRLDPQVWVPSSSTGGRERDGSLHPGGLRAVKAWVVGQLPPSFTGRARWVRTDDDTWALQVTS